MPESQLGAVSLRACSIVIWHRHSAPMLLWCRCPCFWCSGGDGTDSVIHRLTQLISEFDMQLGDGDLRGRDGHVAGQGASSSPGWRTCTIGGGWVSEYVVDRFEERKWFYLNCPHDDGADSSTDLPMKRRFRRVRLGLAPIQSVRLAVRPDHDRAVSDPHPLGLTI